MCAEEKNVPLSKALADLANEGRMNKFQAELADAHKKASTMLAQGETLTNALTKLLEEAAKAADNNRGVTAGGKRTARK